MCRASQVGIDSTKEQIRAATGEKLWLTDPDGFVWEIWVRTGEADQLSDGDGSCCVPAGAAKQESASCCTPAGVGANKGEGCC